MKIVNSCIKGYDIYNKITNFYLILYAYKILNLLSSKPIIDHLLIELVVNKYKDNKIIENIQFHSVSTIQEVFDIILEK